MSRQLRLNGLGRDRKMRILLTNQGVFTQLMRHIAVTAALAILVSLTSVSMTAARTGAASKTAAHRQAPQHAVKPVSQQSAQPVAWTAAAASGINADVLALALKAVSCGIASGDLDAPPTLTVIDYSLPSTAKRLWVFDMNTGKVLFNELVAHGRNTGENMAEHFSDAMESRESSLGLFRTADTYVGHNGYSLRLDGLEPGFNGHARERAIVMHGAAYVSAKAATSNGRIGRSWGCPALREAVARQVIDTVRGGGVIFSYYPDPAWLNGSKFLNCPATTQAPYTVATR